MISMHVHIIRLPSIDYLVTERTGILLTVGEVLALEVGAHIVLGPVVEGVAEQAGQHHPSLRVS